MSLAVGYSLFTETYVIKTEMAVLFIYLLFNDVVNNSM